MAKLRGTQPNLQQHITAVRKLRFKMHWAGAQQACTRSWRVRAASKTGTHAQMCCRDIGRSAGLPSFGAPAV